MTPPFRKERRGRHILTIDSFVALISFGMVRSGVGLTIGLIIKK